jgi:signal transduction histidine kinase
LEGERDNKLINIEVVTASIAHEVRRQLTGIAASGSAALRFLTGLPLDIDKVREILNRMIGDCHRVNEVFDTIRALSRKVDQKREPTGLNERSHGVTAETELAPELPRTDANSLRRGCI